MVRGMVHNVFPYDEHQEKNPAKNQTNDNFDLVPLFRTAPVEAEEDENAENNEEEGADDI